MRTEIRLLRAKIQRLEQKAYEQAFEAKMERYEINIPE